MTLAKTGTLRAISQLRRRPGEPAGPARGRIRAGDRNGEFQMLEMRRARYPLHAAIRHRPAE